MRILYFHQHFTTRLGSTGTRSYEMSQALLAKGHEVHMVCGSFQVADSGLSGNFEKGRRCGIVDGIHVTELQIPYSNSDGFVKRAFAFVKFALSSVKIALTDSYDLVFATSTPLTAGIPGIVASSLRRKKFVFEVRDLWPELPREMGVIKNPVVLNVMSVLEWFSYRTADVCIGLSPGMVDGIRKRAGNKKEIVMIPNGCDVDLFSQSNFISNSVGKPFTAIFSGAHGKANGLDAVLDAAKVLKSRADNNIKIEFIGAGSEKARLVKRAEEEALDNCEFLELLPKTELVAKLHSVDVGLMILDNIPAFYFGTSPNKFFDYLASGLPVLNNYPGWVAEIIEAEKVGIAIPPESPVAFAEALIEMSKDPEKLQAMSDNAISVAKGQFNREVFANEFVKTLESVHKNVRISA